MTGGTETPVAGAEAVGFDPGVSVSISKDIYALTVEKVKSLSA